MRRVVRQALGVPSSIKNAETAGSPSTLGKTGSFGAASGNA